MAIQLTYVKSRSARPGEKQSRAGSNHPFCENLHGNELKRIFWERVQTACVARRNRPSVFFGCAALQTSGSTCTTIMPPQQLALPKCPPSTLTLDDAKAAAHRVAPAVRFHPLEPWYLQSPDVYYENAQLFLTDYLPRGNSTFDFIFESRGLAQAWLQRSFITLLNSTVLSEDEKQQLLAGASFDEAGHSTAKVYYSGGL